MLCILKILYLDISKARIMYREKEMNRANAPGARFVPAPYRTSGDATRATPATRIPCVASHPSRFRIPRAHTLNLTYITFLRSLILRPRARSNARRCENTRHAILFARRKERKRVSINSMRKKVETRDSRLRNGRSSTVKHRSCLENKNAIIVSLVN